MESSDGGGDDLDLAVMAAVKAAEERGDPPLTRAMEAGRCAREKGLELPSLELGFVIVSNLCFSHNSPTLWKLLEQAMASRVVSPLHTVALLTARIIPNRRAEPEAYRIYLELLNRYLFSNDSLGSAAYRDKVTKSIDDSLQLSDIYGIHKMDFGHAIAFFVLTVISSLIDGTLEDWGLQYASTDRHGGKNANEGIQVMDIDAMENSNDKKHDHREQLRRANSRMALDVVEKITANIKVKVFLRLLHFNMPEKFNVLLQRLHFIEAHKSTTVNLMSVNNILVKLFTNIQKVISGDYLLNKQLHGVLVDSGTSSPISCYASGTGRSGCWIPFDIFLENSMDGKNLHALSSIEILTELIKTLQVVNQASWPETFQALWIAALRLIQRDREPWEGPIPRLEARLCMLLAIVPLAIVPVILEERETPYPRSVYKRGMDGNIYSSRKQGLIFCLQELIQFPALISPPVQVVSAANSAASKAATYIFNFKSGSGNVSAINHGDSSVKAVGNLLHLIVEACIARKLIDTSAYFWPGYVVPSTPIKDSVLVQESPWSMLMEGSQPIISLKNALIAIPAPGIAELEKLYQIALHGSEEDKSVAAKVLCSASLTYGWNIQEHVVRIVVKLLSSPVPIACTEISSSSHLISHMPMLGSILFGLARVEVVHILSLYGLLPEVAAILIPICEAFGSLTPESNHRSSPSDETSIYSVFSCAFLFLLRLWKFYKPPQEHYIAGRGGSCKVELTLDYLLLLRNSRIALQNSTLRDRYENSKDPLTPAQPVYIDSFPKLRAWYLQNQACLASTLSGLCNKNPVHQVANKILHMICWKMAKVGTVSGNPSSNSSGSISGSPVSTAEDTYQRPSLPAWEILEAVPFVLEAVLTACEHGRLSSRDLTTGLRDLVDFLPASLATIVSYFSAEITRGVWKPVSMNGTDWPSPAANLHLIESEIKEILASAGVQAPCCYASGTAPMLPLPMAALVSLTITFKLEKNLDYIQAVTGQALENCSTGFSWPSMPIIGALWTQKVRRWYDFIVFCCTLSPFSRDKDAVTQLIRSCFSSFLGQQSSSSHLTSHRGVNGLLGLSISDKGSRLPIAPGFLYLRTARIFQDTRFVNYTILHVVIEWTRTLAAGCSSSGSVRLKSSQSSLASAAAAVREVATLGVSLMCIAGGVQMVKVLYEDTLPAMLMAAREEGANEEITAVTSVLEGYTMAYLLMLGGACVWGTGQTSPAYASTFSSRRARAINVHMEFMAGMVDSNAAVGCSHAMWKAYVSCFVGLLVRFVPAWVPEVRKETLLKLANGLRAWNESELVLELLGLGGPEMFTAVVESVL